MTFSHRFCNIETRLLAVSGDSVLIPPPPPAAASVVNNVNKQDVNKPPPAGKYHCGPENLKKSRPIKTREIK